MNNFFPDGGDLKPIDPISTRQIPPPPPERERLAYRINRYEFQREQRELPPLYPLDLFSRATHEPIEDTFNRMIDLWGAGFDTTMPIRFDVSIEDGDVTACGTKRLPDAIRPPRPEQIVHPLVNITGLDKASVLVALVNAATDGGIGRKLGLFAPSYSRYAAQQLIDKLRITNQPLRFDYVAARPIKVDITDDTFDPTLYDRDSGNGQAARAIAALSHPT